MLWKWLMLIHAMNFVEKVKPRKLERDTDSGPVQSHCPTSPQLALITGKYLPGRITLSQLSLGRRFKNENSLFKVIIPNTSVLKRVDQNWAITSREQVATNFGLLEFAKF